MQQNNSIVVNFTGDVSFTGIFKQKLMRNEEIFDSEIIKIFKEAEENIVNLEGPTTDNTNFLRNNGKVVSPYCSIEYLLKRNICNFNLANNHTFDNGISGFRDTKRAIGENKGNFFGAGENIKEASMPLLLNVKGIKIAILGISHKEGMLANIYSPGVFCAKSNFNRIKCILGELKKTNDWVILNYHGGEEYTTIPMPSRRKFLRRFSKLECDLVIAHHPHVFQGYEKYKGKYIFYSLGNFVFDIPQHKNIQYIRRTGILSLSFSKTEIEFKIIPANINLESGNIEYGRMDFINTVEELSSKINHSDYFKFWIKDANRTFFKSNQVRVNQSHQTPRRYKPLFQIMMDKGSLKRLLFLFTSPNKRPIIFGLILFKLFNFFKLIDEKP